MRRPVVEALPNANAHLPTPQGPVVFFAGGGTGGHLYPGLAIARALGRVAPEARPYFVGAQRGIERSVLPQQGFPFVLLDLHPLYRPAVWRNWRTARGAIGGWRKFGELVRQTSPRLVVGTGGYASGLALAYAAAHGLPIVQQVADSHPGITARWFARFTREAYLGYPEAAQYLHARPGSLIDTGNPIDPPPTPLPRRDEAWRAWNLPDETRSVLLIFGGSQGARALNAVVDAWLARGLPQGLAVIWATGAASYPVHAARASASIIVRPYLSPIADAYAAADFALTRAGAMTTAELCAWGIPMILVPLPTAAADHQTENARALESAGAAIQVGQQDLSVELLDRLIRELGSDAQRRDRLAAAARARGRPGAAEDIARRIAELLG